MKLRTRFSLWVLKTKLRASLFGLFFGMMGCAILYWAMPWQCPICHLIFEEKVNACPECLIGLRWGD